MAVTPWLGFVDDAGHFALDKRQEFYDWLQKFKGQEVIVIVKRRPRRQGSQQLRYLRGVVIPDIAVACGYTDPDDYQSVYEGLMWKFRRLPDGPFGEPRRQSASHDTMSLEEMSKLIDELIVYAETTIPGCTIRRPEEVDMEQVIDREFD